MTSSSSSIAYFFLGWMLVAFLVLAVLALVWRWFLKHGEQFLTVTGSILQSQKNAFLKNTYVSAWIKRHTISLQFFGRRFSRESFLGLPLTLLTVSFVYMLWLLAGLVEDYVHGDPIVAADLRFANLLYAFRGTGLLKFFYFVTTLGSAPIIIGMSLLLSIVLWRLRERIFIVALWLTLIASEGTTFVGKLLFHRARPDLLIRAITENSFSFPSGHATSAAAFYGFLAYLVIRTHTRWMVRVNAFFFALIAIILIDLSRLYLGVHYLSDVLAGDLVGIAGLLFSISVTEWLLSRKKHASLVFPLRIVASMIAIEVVAALGLTLITKTPFVTPPVAVRTNIAVADIPSLFEKGTLPLYTETLTGAHQEPTNIIIIAKDSCLNTSFTKAHWIVADSVSLSSLKKAIGAAVFNSAYPTAPMTPSFYDTKPNDIGFEKATETQSIRARHHARFWKTAYDTPLGSLFVGTVSLDTGIKWGITHAIAPDIDTERDLLVSDLQATHTIQTVQNLKLVLPSLGKNFTGDPFFTDGKAVLLVSSCK